MAKALIINTRITTTEAKAKTLRGVVEPLITLALKNDVHARRQAYQILGDHKLVQRLFDEIGPLFKQGGGGYTRVVKLAIPRKGDAAPLAMIEFTRKPGEAVSEAEAPTKKAKAAKKAVAVAGEKVSLEVKAVKVKADVQPAPEAEVAPEAETVAEAVVETAPAVEAAPEAETVAEAVVETAPEVEAAPEAQAEESAVSEEESKPA